jgi:IclR family pca regulon transcriptional regulator
LFSNGEEFNERDTANPLSARQAEHDPTFMLSLARGLEVLNAFTPQRQRLTISQLSQKTQISRAAVRRCLYTLAALGMVHSPDGRSYELLPRVLAVGHAYLAGTPLAKVAQTALDNLGKASANPAPPPPSMAITCSISPEPRSIIC